MTKGGGQKSLLPTSTCIIVKTNRPSRITHTHSRQKRPGYEITCLWAQAKRCCVRQSSSRSCAFQQTQACLSPTAAEQRRARAGRPGPHGRHTGMWRTHLSQTHLNPERNSCCSHLRCHQGSYALFTVLNPLVLQPGRLRDLSGQQV